MRIAVVGAGPIGLEMATRASRDGHQVVVWEAGRVGEHLRQWGEVTLFTPWRANTSALGREIVSDPVLNSNAHPTGRELVTRYLEPLARWLDVRTEHRVHAIARPKLHKDERLGERGRGEQGFRLLIEGPMGEGFDTADAVIDCTGVFGDPVPAGPGGVPAAGERALATAGQVSYGPRPVRGLAGRDVLLVGDGASATTALLDLLGLDPVPQVVWLTRTSDPPGFVSPPDDPLPGRRALFAAGREALGHPAVRHRPGARVDRFLPLRGRIEVRLDDGGTLEVDHVRVCAGLRPDHGLSRELQVHLCWGTEGPMRLAGALLAASGAGGDCLDQPAQGAETLRNPEPRFFVIGNKSYGRRPDFLLQVGHRQVEQVMGLLEEG